MFPHVPFTAPTTTYTSASVSVSFQPIYHSWKVGRVKFVFTDNRSERDPATDPDTPSKVVWSPTQEAWFMNEMLDTTCPIKIWINTFPWEATNTAPYDGDDGWEDYTYYRQKIANFFTRFSGSIGKIITLSGDAHMTAIDDGLYS
ncbi:MAG: alkaline phosphatase D family protein, partial [Candidatus Fonsibacter sp.]